MYREFQGVAPGVIGLQVMIVIVVPRLFEVGNRWLMRLTCQRCMSNSQGGRLRGPKYEMTGCYAVQIGWCGMAVVTATELILVRALLHYRRVHVRTASAAVEA